MLKTNTYFCLRNSLKILLVPLLFCVGIFCSCTKLDKFESQQNENDPKIKFFNLQGNINPSVKKIHDKIENQNEKFHFINEFVQKQGYALWDKAMIKTVPLKNISSLQKTPTNNITSSNTNGGVEDLILIPLVLQNSNQVHGALACNVNGDSISIRLLDGSNYNWYTAHPDSIGLNGEQVTILLMQLEKNALNHKLFRVIDSSAFGINVNNKSKYVKIVDSIPNNSNITPSVGHWEYHSFTLSYVTYEPNLCGCNAEPCPDGSMHEVYHMETFNWSTYVDDEVPWWQNYNPNGGGSGGGGSGGGNNGSGNGGGNNNSQPVEPDFGLDPLADEHGYYYYRMAQLATLLDNPYAALPCDSLPILNTFGQMFQSVGNFIVPLSIQNRIDSIKSATPNFDTSEFFVQSLNDGASSVVNCDFFPLKINQLPINNITGIRFTPSQFLEFFRKKIDSFSTSAAIFEPYNSGGFNDIIQNNKDTVNSLGAVVHIDMTNDGSVILSGYQNSYLPSNYQSHSFIFSTIVTPFDGYHPVSGNRKFGIYTDNSGGFTFYTMGVDRISKNIFVAGSNVFDFFGNSGFEDADELWSGMQINMINYINSHGGSAQNYSRTNYIVRPKYATIEQFLRGQITYQQLKDILCP
jgi:hypothetical protein